MKKGVYNYDEIANLKTLLLHEDEENVNLGLTLINAREGLLNKELLCMLLMLQKFSPYPELVEQVKNILRDKAPSASTLKNYHSVLSIFDVNGRSKLNYLPKFDKFYKSMFFKNRYFLQNDFWRQKYHQLLHIFKQHQQQRLSLILINELLIDAPQSYFLNTDKFNILSDFISKGEYYEEIPSQIEWLKYWVKLHNNFGAMVHCTIGQYYRLLKNDAEAEKHYLLSIKACRHRPQDNHEAMASNNLAVIYCERGTSPYLAEAYQLSLRAVDLSPKNHYYLETLAYLEWKYKLNYGEALALYEEAIFIETNNLAARANKAALLVELKKPYQAKNDLEWLFNADLKHQKDYLKYTREGLLLYQKLALSTYQDEEKGVQIQQLLDKLASY